MQVKLRNGDYIMISIYKNEKTAQQHGKIVSINDVFFNINTSGVLDLKANKIIEKIDGAKLIDKFKIISSLDQNTINADKLSTGCKTALNVLYYPEMIFDLRECGDNALSVIYSLSQGQVYCEYACIPFEFKCVKAIDEHDIHIIDDFCDLKEWWDK